MIGERKRNVGSLLNFLKSEFMEALKPIINPEQALKDIRSGDPYNLNKYPLVKESKPANKGSSQPN